MSVAGRPRPCCAAEFDLGPAVSLFAVALLIAVLAVAATSAEPHTGSAPRSDSSHAYSSLITPAERPGTYSDDEVVRSAALHRCAAGLPSGLVVGASQGARP